MPLYSSSVLGPKLCIDLQTVKTQVARADHPPQKERQQKLAISLRDMGTVISFKLSSI